jgi:Ricin-type beta-trefoil lectin domain
MHRKLKIAFAALALSAGLAGQAQAATSTVRLHTAADTSRFLSDTASGVTSMNKSNPADANQKWVKTDTTSGYATYRNVQTGRCLTGRSPVGFPVVTAQRCVAGATNQQWRLGVSGDFQLRLNGAVAFHNTAGNGTGVLMTQLFTNQANQKWHTHPA